MKNRKSSRDLRKRMKNDKMEMKDKMVNLERQNSELQKQFKDMQKKYENLNKRYLALKRSNSHSPLKTKRSVPSIKRSHSENELSSILSSKMSKIEMITPMQASKNLIRKNSVKSKEVHYDDSSNSSDDSLHQDQPRVVEKPVLKITVGDDQHIPPDGKNESIFPITENANILKIKKDDLHVGDKRTHTDFMKTNTAVEQHDLGMIKPAKKVYQDTLKLGSDPLKDYVKKEPTEAPVEGMLINKFHDL